MGRLQEPSLESAFFEITSMTALQKKANLLWARVILMMSFRDYCQAD
jgi:hypothetical protein